MKFRPVNERIVIKRVESDDRTPGGIIIPDNAQEKPQIGEVLAVPEEDGTFEVEIGDRVLFGKWSGVEVKIEDQDVLIIKQEDILGIF